ncbi:MAG: thiamine phosphate synthase [Nitrospinota bacterium]
MKVTKVLNETAACPVNANGFGYNGAALNLPAFPSLETSGVSLYPIVDSAQWVRRLAPLGINIIQLRIKEATGKELEKEIAESVEASKKNNVNLFVNDFWKLAAKHGAYGVHLGQGDLIGADIPLIRESGLRLGVSTHCYHEAEVAANLKPSYVAFGPVFETKLKKMPFPPQGVGRLKEWKKMFDCPLVAIGGITLEDAKEVMTARPDLISVVRDITLAADTEGRVEMWLKLLESIYAGK